MATSMRAALAGAVVTALRAALSDTTVQRGRRAAVSEQERPLILAETGEATADEAMSPGETFWTLDITVTAYLATSRDRQAGASGADADVVAEDALGDIEAAIVAALQGQVLARPGGGDLTLGLEAAGSFIDITDALSAAKRLGQVSVSFRAQLVLPTGTTTYP